MPKSFWEYRYSKDNLIKAGEPVRKKRRWWPNREEEVPSQQESHPTANWMEFLPHPLAMPPNQAWYQDSPQFDKFIEISSKWKFPPILVNADNRNAFNKRLLACFILKKFPVGTEWREGSYTFPELRMPCLHPSLPAGPPQPQLEMGQSSGLKRLCWQFLWGCSVIAGATAILRVP